MKQVKRVHKHRHWGSLIGATILALVAVPLLPEPYGGPEVLVASVAGIWSFGFYLQQRHSEDARFLKELMSEFNGRYNELNGPLQTAMWSEGEFSNEQKLKFIDYFNLCAEEHVFWQKGYIDAPIWEAWRAGMAYYGRDPRVRRLWMEERGPSYYGFELPD